VIVAMLAATSSSGGHAVAQDDDVVIESEEIGISVRRLLEQAAAATGEPFFFDRLDVDHEHLSFAGSIRVRRDEILELVDGVLRLGEFVRLEHSIGSQRVHQVRHLGQQSRGQMGLKTLARIVTREELDRIADRSELITTSWASRHCPAADWDDTICIFFTDSSVQCVRSIDGTSTLIITGFSNEVAARVRMMERVDAELGARTVAAPEATTRLERRIEALERRVERLLDARENLKSEGR